MKNITTVILAAGRSTRFISNKSKLTHDLAGLPIVSHVYNTAKKISGKNVIVVCNKNNHAELNSCLLYTSPSPRDGLLSRMPSSA